jgi:hypothetical protein
MAGQRTLADCIADSPSTKKLRAVQADLNRMWEGYQMRIRIA